MIDAFADLAAYAALPRVTSLALSPDGRRLVAAVQEPDAKGARYALWEIPLQDGDPVRLTRSEKGESSPVFAPDGSLLFVSSRPAPDGDGEDEAALWSLPATGEPTVLVQRAGGVGGPVVATGSGDVLLSGSRLTYSTNDADGAAGDDRARRKTRKDRRISAILHTGMPIRYWDHEVGDVSPRLLLRTADGDVRDLAPDAALELLEASCSISADGRTVATDWGVPRRGALTTDTVVVIDVASGERTVLADEDGWSFGRPVISPDGRSVALARGRDATFERSIRADLLVLPASGGAAVEVELGDLHPSQWIWSPDCATLFVAGDLHGRGAVLAVDPATGSARQIVTDTVYSSLCVAPDGSALYALRAPVEAAPHPVRIDVADGTVTPLPTPAPTPPLPGRLVELSVPAADGATVHGWLCLPEPSGTPAPVMLWIHGGPFGSYNAWSWRWNPWVAVAHGWAVVMPDPGMSTGYGEDWLQRAWPYVAAEVYADCEAVLDAVLERDDVDATRVACLGASFGGYMTNWVAGHVDRFAAIVTHAGSYALDQQHKTTDAAYYKTHTLGVPAEHPEWYQTNSPHNATVGSTPMLLTHGLRDYRVPISEAFRLWYDLVSTWDGEPDTMPHRFLQLTGENHWVLSPANTEIWYDAVLGFCAEHVLGRPWTPSELL